MSNIIQFKNSTGSWPELVREHRDTENNVLNNKSVKATIKDYTYLVHNSFYDGDNDIYNEDREVTINKKYIYDGYHGENASAHTNFIQIKINRQQFSHQHEKYFKNGMWRWHPSKSSRFRLRMQNKYEFLMEKKINIFRLQLPTELKFTQSSQIENINLLQKHDNINITGSRLNKTNNPYYQYNHNNKKYQIHNVINNTILLKNRLLDSENLMKVWF